MKNYTITVNGISYEVSVQENTGAPAAQVPVAQAPVQVAPAQQAAAPQAAPTPAPAASGSKGSIEIESPMPGKILSVPVKEGQAINKGDVVAVLEAMKMENDIVAAEAGTVASVDVTVGQMIESGDIIATLN